MAQHKYLDLNGLSTFNENLKDTLITKEEIETRKNDIAELQSYFTKEGYVKKAKSDSKGNIIDSTYIKEVTNFSNSNTIEGKFGNGTSIPSIVVNDVASTKDTIYTSNLEGHSASYFATVNDISEMINGIIWRPNVETINDLKALQVPKEGWTVSINENNEIYRFDSQSEGPSDDKDIIAPNDSTTGFWIRLDFTNYPKASITEDGIMSKEQVVSLEQLIQNIKNVYDTVQNGVSTTKRLITSRNFSISNGLVSDTLQFDGTNDVEFNVTEISAPTLQNIVSNSNLVIGGVDTLGIVGVSSEEGNLLKIDEDSTLQLNINLIEDNFIDDMFNGEIYYVNVKDDSDKYDILVNGEKTIGKTYFMKGKRVEIFAQAKGDTDQDSLKLKVTKVQ